MRPICACCGEPVDEWPTDWAQGWPRAVVELSGAERAERVESGTDVVVVRPAPASSRGPRYFVRGVLYVPIQEPALRFGSGLWAEVTREVFSEIGAGWEDLVPDTTKRWPGLLSATRVPMWPELDGLPVSIRYDEDPTRRPHFAAASPGACHADQQHGIPVERWHHYIKLLEAGAE